MITLKLVATVIQREIMKDMNQGRYFIGQAIRSARTDLNMSLNTLAARSGVRLESISKIERGVFNVGADTIKKITDAMGLTIQFKIVSTLAEFRDLINQSEDWDLLFNNIMEYNGWDDLSNEADYKICRDKSGNELRFTDNGKVEMYTAEELL